MSYLRGATGTRRTPPSEPIPGSAQVPNSAGGYAWTIDPLARLRRFLILGAEGGTYYASQREHLAGNVQALHDADPLEAVKLTIEVSEEGRAPKNDPAILALAFYAGYGGSNPDARALEVRRVALDALPRVCRTGTHLLHFLEFVEQYRGHGPGLNKAIARWFTREDVDELAYQLVKYRQRDDWAQRDAIRLARPKPPTPAHDALFRWLIEQKNEVKGDRSERYAVEGGELPRAVVAYQRAQAAKTLKETVALLAEYGGTLPREALNTDHLKSPEVWEALLYAGHGMPLGALIRNLPTMTRVGLIAPMSSHVAEVTRRITDPDGLKRARVHPLQLLVAHLTYGAGRSLRGSATWQPISQVVDALDAGFYTAFGAVEATGKRMLLALDVSGSMDCGTINGVPGLTPRIAAAAMALVTAAVEPNHYFLAFSHTLVPLEISPRERLDAVVRKMQNTSFGGTDCALPMLWASGITTRPTGRAGVFRGRYGEVVELHDGGKVVPVDAFLVYTDSETWAGNVHPAQALVQYREKTGIQARSIVVGMVSNEFSIADPADPGMLDVVGFDTSTPQMISDFVSGRI